MTRSRHHKLRYYCKQQASIQNQDRIGKTGRFPTPLVTLFAKAAKLFPTQQSRYLLKVYPHATIRGRGEVKLRPVGGVPASTISVSLGQPQTCDFPSREWRNTFLLDYRRDCLRITSLPRKLLKPGDKFGLACFVLSQGNLGWATVRLFIHTQANGVGRSDTVLPAAKSTLPVIYVIWNRPVSNLSFENFKQNGSRLDR
jgi:hypothetical protein